MRDLQKTFFKTCFKKNKNLFNKNLSKMKTKIFFLAATTAAASANAQNFIVDGHEAVDLGVSVLWATCNIGAETPNDYGLFFAWGDTVGYVGKNKDTTHLFSWENYFDDQTGEGISFNTYFINGGKTKLDAEHDAATHKWGKNWRMPTKEEFEELLNLRVGGRITEGFISGNKNSILLRPSGYFDSKNIHSGVGLNMNFNYYSCFWTSSLYNDEIAYSYRFEFNPNIRHYVKTDKKRCYGLPIRPVCEKSVVTKLNYVEKDNANTVYKTIENGQIVIVKNGVKYNLRGQKM